jgi:probable rRNA maturation factor
MDVTIDIAVEYRAWDALGDVEGIARRAIAAALAGADLDIQAGSELSLVLADDAFVQGLNKVWRGKDQPTNVLSFPTEEPMLLGDIVVAYETSAAEAEVEGKSLADHLAHLVVHGFLHLAGFDHEDDDEADEMEALEVDILGSLGIASPYADIRDNEEDRSPPP